MENFYKIKNLLILIKFIAWSLVLRRKKKCSPRRVHTITYRAFSPDGGKGGGSAVQSCQQVVMKDLYGDIELKYTYFLENEYFRDWRTRLADLWGGVYFAITETRNESDAVYITHDYGTGFGLALLRKKFVYVSHLQGPRVEEKISYNEYINKLDIKIIQFCERYVFRKSLYVCFPSYGACDHYFSSKYKGIERKQAKIGPVLYNTLYAHPEPVQVANAASERNSLTFISIGALTFAKGIDQLPSFFEEYLKIHHTAVRWIVVGQGYLKGDLQHHIDMLVKRFDNFSVFLKENCSYPEIRYLMKISDIYIMFHRVSIFDLATLEAMESGKCIVLSKIGGNQEFNKNNNIIFHDGDNAVTAKRIEKVDFEMFGKRNVDAYNQYFSNDAFAESYSKVMNDLLR